MKFKDLMNDVLNEENENDDVESNDRGMSRKEFVEQLMKIFNKYKPLIGKDEKYIKDYRKESEKVFKKFYGKYYDDIDEWGKK